MENNQIQPDTTLIEQPSAINVDEAQDNTFNNEETVDKQESSSLSLKTFSEYLLATLALMVICALVFGINDMGMFGMAIFFIYGFCLIVYVSLKPVIKAYKAKNYTNTLLLSIAAGIVLWVMGGILWIGYWIVTLMLGFWEINS